MWYFTTSEIDSHYERKAKHDWYLRVRNAHCGYSAYLDRGSFFYQLLAFAALIDEVPGELSEGTLSERYSPCNMFRSGAGGLRLWSELECFGDRLAAIGDDPVVRAVEIPRVVQQCISSSTERELLAEARTVRDFVWAEHPDSWPQIAYWLAVNSWPAPDVTLGGVGYMSTSYEDRFGHYGFWLRVEGLHDELIDSGGDPEIVHALLRSALTEAQDDRLLSQASNGHEVPVLGLSAVRSDHLLFVVGPLVALAYLVFYMSWDRAQVSSSRLIRKYEKRYGFPSFGAPVDPLSANGWEWSLVALGGRVLWALFLVSPIAVLIGAFLFRGNLSSLVFGPSVDRTLGPGDWFLRQLFAQPPRWMSLGMDTVNLFALWLVVACFLGVVGQVVDPGRRRRAAACYALALAVFVFIGGRTFVALGLSSGPAPWVWSFLLYAAFGILWCWSLARSVKASSLTGIFISLIGYVVSIMIFL